MVLMDAGMIGIPLSEFYQMNEYEFSLIKAGYQKRQVTEWEHTRFIAWMIQATQSTKPLKVEEILPLPIDEERKVAQAKLKRVAKVSKKKLDYVFGRLGIDLEKGWQDQP